MFLRVSLPADLYRGAGDRGPYGGGEILSARAPLCLIFVIYAAISLSVRSSSMQPVLFYRGPSARSLSFSMDFFYLVSVSAAAGAHRPRSSPSGAASGIATTPRPISCSEVHRKIMIPRGELSCREARVRRAEKKRRRAHRGEGVHLIDTHERTRIEGDVEREILAAMPGVEGNFSIMYILAWVLAGFGVSSRGFFLAVLASFVTYPQARRESPVSCCTLCRFLSFGEEELVTIRWALIRLAKCESLWYGRAEDNLLQRVKFSERLLGMFV